MNVVEEAIIFATKAHEGQKRKLTGTPYILHPLEVANIIATLTDDLDICAAGVLHDTIEDCHVDPEVLKEKFGPRVSALVQAETEDRFSNRSEEETWQERKEESLLMLHFTKDRGVKIMWLADKLSNIRSFHRTYLKIGDHVFDTLHEKRKEKQGWYYRTIAAELKEFEDTAAYQEYVEHVEAIFGKE